jgi:capsule polysaccharide export protein KpsE/RkpR
MGLDWWSRDPFFTGQKQADAVGSGNDAGEIEALQQRIEALEEQLRASRPELAGKPETENAAEGS